MNPPSDPDLRILRRWGNAVVPLEDHAVAAARRPRAVGTIAAAIRNNVSLRARERRRSRLSITISAVVGAAAALVVITQWSAHPAPTGKDPVSRLRALEGASVVVHEGRQQVASALDGLDLPVSTTDEIMTDSASRARLDLPNGVAIAIAAQAKLGFEGGGTSDRQPRGIRLVRGSVHVDVPKLSAGHTFTVHTPDALVTVHGTSFSVDLGGGEAQDPARTHVTVTEGTVSVQCDGAGETFVHAGMEWTCGDHPAADPRASVIPAPTAATPGPPTTPRLVSANLRPRPSRAEPIGADRPSSQGEGSSSDQLGEQNRILTGAMQARRQGDPVTAARILDGFLSTYSVSPLRQEAEVEHFRALEQAGEHATAAHAARSYLAAYANGFATEEARRLALPDAAR